MTAIIDSPPWLNVGVLSDGRVLQANGRVVRQLGGQAPIRPGLEEADVLQLVGLRRLTWLPHRTGSAPHGRWVDTPGWVVRPGSNTENWINHCRDTRLMRLTGQLRGELSPTGWRRYRHLLNRGLTPLEHFHELWSRCRAGSHAWSDFFLAATDADYVVGVLSTTEGTFADRWLAHAERALSAIAASGPVRAVNLDLITDSPEGQ